MSRFDVGGDRSRYCCNVDRSLPKRLRWLTSRVGQGTLRQIGAGASDGAKNRPRDWVNSDRVQNPTSLLSGWINQLMGDLRGCFHWARRIAQSRGVGVHPRLSHPARARAVSTLLQATQTAIS